ncbi:UDP-N-acetylglucosamine 2-epimerase (non-hydrolyzing) [Amylibacter sp.]|nr:UDP-N-acetylglucosamine 2-epimerase (non-hydrolyzing) [Amylibacter sp.]MDB4095633.1 UDP-N-acetylglucosamine 2-epimerase (non-hydrolyzing) [Amylibacter sp.]
MKILSVIGARPQFVKAAVFRDYCLNNNVKEILVNTGQHYDPWMSNGIFHELNVPDADYNFTINERSHASMTAEMMKNIETTINHEKPDFVNLYGDTNSTLAGALVAYKLNIPVIHIEAGLRSFNKIMPEEKNRILTDHSSSILLCPTKTAVTNLKNEGIVRNVHHVGDIMFDAVTNFKQLFTFPKNIKADGRELALVTLHRVENLSDKTKLVSIIDYLRTFSSRYQLIFPIHPNTLKYLKNYDINYDFLTTIHPLIYTELQGLLADVSLVLTDSGGLQKEAYFHRKECITLREETEWVETINSGWNVTWQGKRLNKKYDIDDYGDGRFCETALNIIKDYEFNKD